MAVERKRGCGYRKIGGLYLVTEPWSFQPCDRMPIKLECCEYCGAGIKPARGWTWIKPEAILNGDHLLAKLDWLRFAKKYTHHLCPEDWCPVCRPEMLAERCGLLWINPRHYTPESFMEESRELGLSRRIPAVPKGFELGKTWVLMAHRDAGGVFMAVRPKRIEKLVKMNTPGPELERLKKRGITPIRVPENDPDHNPKKE